MATDADDIFASLGGSLMRDILGTSSATTSEDILSSLEAELDASMPPNSNLNTNINNANYHAAPTQTNLTLGVGNQGMGRIGGMALPPPGLQMVQQAPPTLNSGAALIVSHQQQSNILAPPPHLVQSSLSNQLPTSSTNPVATASSATTPWSGASFGFDASAVDDFLRNDAERKKEKDSEEEEMRKAMDRVLFEDDEEDLTIQTSSNVNAPPGLGGFNTRKPTSGLMSPSPMPPGNVNRSVPPPSNVSWNTKPPVPSGVPPPPSLANPAAMLPPFLQSKVSTSLPAPLVSAPPPQAKVPPHVQQQPPLPLVKVGPPPSLPMPPPHPVGFSTGGPIIPHPLPNQQMSMQVPHMNATGPPPFLHAPIPLQSVPPPQPDRFYFHHPHPTSPPVPASQVASSLMTSRDLSYVIHSILRPLHVLHTDPQEDYYFLERGRKLRLMMQNMNMGMNMTVGFGMAMGNMGTMPMGQEGKEESNSAPSTEKEDKTKKNKKGKKNKETKLTPEKARVLEALFREKVETRAKEWKDKSQVLGHVVKSNVHRPRALLDLSSPDDVTNENMDAKHQNSNDGGEKKNVMGEENESEEDQETSRAMIWKARKLVDQGYSFWLKEDFKLLAQMILEKESTNSEEEEKETNELENFVNLGMLLTLPKGRDLLSRCLEYKRAPMGHSGNYTDLSTLMNFESIAKGKYIFTPMQLLEILPALFSNLFVHPAGVKKGEDRLLYVIISYIIAIVDDFSKDSLALLYVGNKLIASLKTVMDLSKFQFSNKNSLKKMLDSRARAEIMHALMTKGMEICEHSEALGSQWKVVEEEFINILSQA